MKFLYNDDYEYMVPDEESEEPAEAQIIGDSSLEATLTEKYRDMIRQNFYLNKDRNAEFFKAFNLIIIALILAFIGAFPYITLRETSGKKSQRVVIDNDIRVNIMPDTTNRNSKQQPDISQGNGSDTAPIKKDSTGLSVYRLRDRYTTEESRKKGEWVRRK